MMELNSRIVFNRAIGFNSDYYKGPAEKIINYIH